MSAASTRPPVLPPHLTTVANLTGPISVAAVNPIKSVQRMTDHLTDAGVDWYCPRQTVTGWRTVYDDGVPRRRETVTHPPFLPGLLIVGHGHKGREVLGEYGRRWQYTLRNWIGPVYDSHVGAKLARELAAMEAMLAKDPTLATYSGIVRGVQVRIIAGPFQDFTAVVEDQARPGRVIVRLPMLQTSIPLELAITDLERLD